MAQTTFRLTLLALFTVLMASCVTISFDQPQPQRSQILENFPIEMIGAWIGDEGDSLVFSKTEFSTSEINASLDGMNILKVEEGMYFLNLKEEDYYMIFMGRLNSANELAVFWFDIDDEQTITNLKTVCPAEEFLDSDGDVERFHFSPSVEQFQEIIDKRLYSVFAVYHK